MHSAEPHLKKLLIDFLVDILHTAKITWDLVCFYFIYFMSNEKHFNGLKYEYRIVMKSRNSYNFMKIIKLKKPFNKILHHF